jgi:hypothetical protein
MIDGGTTADQRLLEICDPDSEYRNILNSLLKIFESEFTRFDRIAKRHAELKKRCVTNKSQIPTLEKDTKSMNTIIVSQN